MCDLGRLRTPRRRLSSLCVVLLHSDLQLPLTWPRPASRDRSTRTLPPTSPRRDATRSADPAVPASLCRILNNAPPCRQQQTRQLSLLRILCEILGIVADTTRENTSPGIHCSTINGGHYDAEFERISGLMVTGSAILARSGRVTGHSVRSGLLRVKTLDPITNMHRRFA